LKWVTAWVSQDPCRGSQALWPWVSGQLAVDLRCRGCGWLWVSGQVMVGCVGLSVVAVGLWPTGGGSQVLWLWVSNQAVVGCVGLRCCGRGSLANRQWIWLWVSDQAVVGCVGLSLVWVFLILICCG
jgi:hypothetical protein